MRKLFFLLLFLSIDLPAQLRQHRIDSLSELLKAAKDTTRANALASLAQEYTTENYERARTLAQQSLDLSRSIRYERGTCAALNMLGLAEYYQARYDSAMGYLRQALALAEKIKDEKRIGKLYQNIGLVHDDRSDYDSALYYYFEARKIMEKINDRKSLASSLNNIGNIYSELKNYKMALDYFRQSLAIKLKLGDKYYIGTAFHNIGLAHKRMGNFDSALFYYRHALEYRRQSGDSSGMGLTWLNIGSILDDRKDYDQAIAYYDSSYAIKKKKGDKYSMILALQNLAEVYTKKNDLGKATAFEQQTLKLAKAIGARSEQAAAYKGFSLLYREKKDFEKALAYFDSSVTLSDSIALSESAMKLSDIESKYRSEKKDKELQLAKKNAEIQKAEDNKRMFLLAGIASAILLLALLFYVRYRQKKSANALLEEKNRLIEAAYKDINDSINYAQRIQTAILPDEGTIRHNFSDLFIFFRPKQTVSGDFYWFAEDRGKKVIAAVDCTGHGVPGAIMSMIGNSLLNEIFYERKIYDPGRMLNYLHEGIRLSLKQEDSAGSQDGMDIAICAFDEKNSCLAFAGAHRPLYIIRKGELLQTRPDHFSVGGKQGNESRTFTSHSVLLEKNDQIYLFSDGYADQFGGKTAKKFKIKNFQNLLLSVHEKTMEQQRSILESTFLSWMGHLEQVDDVLVIGLKI